jgi:hypothetical protein
MTSRPSEAWLERVSADAARFGIGLHQRLIEPCRPARTTLRTQPRGRDGGCDGVADVLHKRLARSNLENRISHHTLLFDRDQLGPRRGATGMTHDAETRHGDRCEEQWTLLRITQTTL